MTIVHAVVRIATDAPCIALLLYGGFSHAYQKKTTFSEDGSVAFPIEPITLWLCIICIPIFLYWGILTSTKLDFASHYLDLMSRALEVFTWGWIGIGLLLALPGTLIVTPEGIERQFWLKSNRQVLWGEIEQIIVGADRVEIVAANGKKVVHERFNLDRERFLFELKQYCTEDDFAERLDQNIVMAEGKKPVS